MPSFVHGVCAKHLGLLWSQNFMKIFFKFMQESIFQLLIDNYNTANMFIMRRAKKNLQLAISAMQIVQRELTKQHQW